ncbi:MFS transporter, partial [Bifidobacterium longum]
MIRFFEKFGIPRVLLLGFLAVAIFMTGDGFELTFLSKFMVDQGFSSSQASLLVTVYGLFTALGGWCAGVLAEMFGARHIMMFGACWWIGIHLLFLGVAIPSGLYSLILSLYALRGIGYPLFIYSFVVLMAQYISPARLASATGFFWTCFSLGIGVFSAYLPSFIMPVFGEYKTFWFALPFSIVGTVMCFFFVPKNKIVKSQGLSRKEQLAELAEGATILVTNRKVLICAIIRIINNLLLYG